MVWRLEVEVLHFAKDCIYKLHTIIRTEQWLFPKHINQMVFAMEKQFLILFGKLKSSMHILCTYVCVCMYMCVCVVCVCVCECVYVCVCMCVCIDKINMEWHSDSLMSDNTPKMTAGLIQGTRKSCWGSLNTWTDYFWNTKTANSKEGKDIQHGTQCNYFQVHKILTCSNRFLGQSTFASQPMGQCPVQ